MRDRRDEFADVPWQQGRLLMTRTVMRMPEKWRREAEAEEQCLLCAHFTPMDEGRSRVHLWRFNTAAECAAAVHEHNLALYEAKRAAGHAQD